MLFKIVSHTAQDAILSGKGNHASVDMQAFCRGKVRSLCVMGNVPLYAVGSFFR
ncbi:hypothetical protein BACINT_04528 [Bacteroides intestinalis DSM 17393]|uniref:Uncharacterized protein n=1 Tax=Bacteroides intestinalis DSM 17393 TaxID=471870 RepID=B3CGL1_9BACE|nr:hypothetical protein BACINT_04528 [Bacteroides intestinalis DSM 17393]